ncbi:MAG: anti-sigma factor [Nibricoccus sp.]
MPSENLNPFRLPAPSPCRTCTVSRVGWITASVALLLAAFLCFRLLAARAEIKLEHNNAELTLVEVKSLKQQLYAERILAERQMADLTNAAKTETVLVAHLLPIDPTASFPSAMVVWLPSRQSGVLLADKLPEIGADEELRLWITESDGPPQNVAEVTPASGRSTKITFKAIKPTGLSVRFSVTRERKGATGTPTGPTLMMGAP